MNRANLFNVIEERLSFLATRITSRGKLNILDFHGHSEYFYQYFLNEVYGWNVTNENDNKQNVEAIDLIDHENKFVIQVSSTATKQKIENSLSKDLLNKYKTYTFKFISIAKDASALRKEIYVNPSGIKFSPSTDVIDKDSILSKIRGLPAADLERIYKFIKSELVFEIDPIKLESNLAAIINILSKEEWNTSESSTTVNSFEIDRKISYNKLSVAESIIRDYTIYHGRVDKIYSEFDLQGKNKSISVLATIRREYARVKATKVLTEDRLFFDVISGVEQKVLNSSNYTSIPTDELELSVNILVVDAFVRCKIFENPNDYRFAIT